MFVYNFNRVFEVNCPLKVNKNTIPLCMGGDKSTPRASAFSTASNCTKTIGSRRNYFSRRACNIINSNQCEFIDWCRYTKMRLQCHTKTRCLESGGRVKHYVLGFCGLSNSLSSFIYPPRGGGVSWKLSGTWLIHAKLSGI